MKVIFALLTAVLVILTSMVGWLYFSQSDAEKSVSKQEQPLRHIQLVTQNSNEHFWSMFKDGALEAGEELNLYVEFVDVPTKNPDTIAETAEQAIYASVDGLALQAADTERTALVLEEASKAGIPVITYENDIFPISDVPTVGSNGYDAGYSLGQMAAEACQGKATVAVLLESSTAGAKTTYKNLKLQGIMDALSGYQKISVKETYSISADSFEVEKLSNSILTERPEIDLILCAGETSTPGVAQVLVDANRVGEIRVVGYGAMPQTLDYIERGVIYGTVCPDAFEIGSSTVRQLKNLLEGEQISNSLNTGMYTVTAENLGEFREKTTRQLS
ncbi:substrate-binding domain-containing protein [Clostridium sp. D33t1_170424_F3]|uniref:sugar ABC transporter substrate-binding protein n=1 Tax=Clostridium sp. D33t1_170424_F3 TaxID=2787099 RepID=UPI0018AB2A81|nr:substrate-binding domain-containing protein [Clostridium sp. D33t1_170424_F3]